MSGRQPISEPFEYNAQQEEKLRALIERHAAYAESGPTFDKSGKYLCGDCSAKLGTANCRLVEGTISFEAGSCRLWTTEAAAKAYQGQKLSQPEASYAERPQAKGFGCSRCEYASDSSAVGEERDRASLARSLWCGFWGLHVMPKACCSEESGPDLVMPKADKDADV